MLTYLFFFFLTTVAVFGAPNDAHVRVKRLNEEEQADLLNNIMEEIKTTWPKKKIQTEEDEEKIPNTCSHPAKNDLMKQMCVEQLYMLHDIMNDLADLTKNPKAKMEKTKKMFKNMDLYIEFYDPFIHIETKGMKKYREHFAMVLKDACEFKADRLILNVPGDVASTSWSSRSESASYHGEIVMRFEEKNNKTVLINVDVTGKKTKHAPKKCEKNGIVNELLDGQNLKKGDLAEPVPSGGVKMPVTRKLLGTSTYVYLSTVLDFRMEGFDYFEYNIDWMFEELIEFKPLAMGRNIAGKEVSQFFYANLEQERWDGDVRIEYNEDGSVKQFVMNATVVELPKKKQ